MTMFFNNPLLIIVIVLFSGFVVAQAISETRIDAIRACCLYTSLIVLFLGVLSCLAFNQSVAGFQFLFRVDSMPVLNNLTFTLGADGFSMIFLLLTLLVFPVCFTSSWAVEKKTKSFFVYLLAMEFLLVLTFTTLDLFYFFVFFESLLIPMFIMIGVWGARERKIKAAYLFFLYTLFGSLIMLFGVIYLYLITGSTNYFVLLNTALDADQQKVIWLCFFMAFAIKMPLFPFHIWLPEAHVEAPTVGSMLLASLLLKLGGYGFLRFSLSMLQEGSFYFNSLVSTFALLGVVFGSLSTVRQIDLKRVIAYSSVAHMNLVMLGLFSNNQQGIEGAVYLMVAHGVVSTALFFCVGVLYDRYHSRLIRYYGGLVTVMPLFAFFFFSFTLANMSFPGTSNFLGELLLFLGVFAKNSTVLLFSTAGIVLSAVYSVWLFNRVIFGTLKTRFISRFTEVSRRETAILVFLLISMVILGVSADFLLTALHFPTQVLLASTSTCALGVPAGRCSAGFYSKSGPVCAVPLDEVTGTIVGDLTGPAKRGQLNELTSSVRQMIHKHDVARAMLHAFSLRRPDLLELEKRVKLTMKFFPWLRKVDPLGVVHMETLLYQAGACTDSSKVNELVMFASLRSSKHEIASDILKVLILRRGDLLLPGKREEFTKKYLPWLCTVSPSDATLIETMLTQFHYPTF